MIYNMRGDTYHAAPVMLSDVYTSAVGSAKDGVAASQRALYDAYNSLNSRILEIDAKTVLTTSKTLAGGANADAYADTTRTGYTSIGVVGWRSFSTSVYLYNCFISGNSVCCGIHNFSTSQLSGSMAIVVLYKKN